MKKNIKTNEGLADLAQKAEHDHEVQMARADLYKLAKYSIKLHDMLKNISEAEGLEGWKAAKITKASDYISSVYHSLDYEMKVDGDLGEGKSPHKKGSAKYKKQMAAKHASMNETMDDETKEKIRSAYAKSSGDAKSAEIIAKKMNLSKNEVEKVLDEAKGKDQDGDGDKDFADVQIARMVASGMSKEEAKKKVKDKKYNETVKEDIYKSKISKKLQEQISDVLKGKK